MDRSELIRKAARGYKKDIVAFARNIVRTPSFSTQEGKLVALIKKEMLKVGFDKVKIDRMGNIIGFIGHGKKRIMLDAHIDTVGIGDKTAWKIDPFAGLYRNDTIYGRGATDMKSGKVVTTIPIGEGVDGNAFDPKTKLAFASCGDGTVTIAREDGDKLTVVQTLQTEKSARTMTIDPLTHKIYLPAAKFEAPEPGQRRGKMVAGSFKILIYGMDK